MGCQDIRMRYASMRFTLALMSSWLCLSGAHAQMNLNPEYGSPPYDAFTVFSPDVADPGKYAKDVLVVFHGFASAVPNGTYKRLRKRLHKHMTVIGINYDPLKVGESTQFLDRVATEHLKGKRVFVLGTSLGGFWAQYFAVRIKAHGLIMLNPVIDVRSRLGMWVGTKRVNKRRRQSYEIRAGAFDGYAAMPTRYHDRPQTLLVLTADDGSLDPLRTKQFFTGAPNVEIVWYETGGHTIDLRKHPALDRIAQFVRAR